MAHLHIGVDAQFELAAMRGAALYPYFDPEVAFVRQTDLQAGPPSHARRLTPFLFSGIFMV
jgi:hypothetical protein